MGWCAGSPIASRLNSHHDNQAFISQNRIAVVAIALLLGFSLLVVQLFRWTVFARDEYRPELHLPADLAHTAGRPRGDERGVIVDQHGVPLAIDRFRWEVWVEPNCSSRHRG